jgi:hypothetical protein
LALVWRKDKTLNIPHRALSGMKKRQDAKYPPSSSVRHEEKARRWVSPIELCPAPHDDWP